MDFEDMLNELDSTSNITKPLTRVAGRNYVYKQPASVRVTRQNRQEILKQTDPEQVKATMELAFEHLIAAATGTPAQQITISKINQMRRQIFDKLEK